VVRVSAVLTTATGEEHRFENVAFAAPDGRPSILLLSDRRLDHRLAFTSVVLVSSPPLVARSIRWVNDTK
jgi:hypothetical protein